jgi:hypothetical protein
MNQRLPRIKLLAIPIAVAAALAYWALSAGSSPKAEAQSLFSPATLLQAMQDFYCQFPGQPADAGCPAGTPGAQPATPIIDPKDLDKALDPRPAPSGLSQANQMAWKLTTADQKILALEIFDDIVALDAERFNETMLDLGRDYYLYPSHRAGIELLLSMIDVQRSAGVYGTEDHSADAVRLRLRQQITGIRHQSKLDTVLHRAFHVVWLAGLVRGMAVGPYKAFKFWRSEGRLLGARDALMGAARQFGKGFIYTSEEGIGIRGNVRAMFNGEFRGALLNFVGDKRVQLFAAGAAWGAVDLILDSFKTYKVDPHHVLEPMQAQIAEDAGLLAAKELAEIKAMAALPDAALNSQQDALRKRLNEIQADYVRIDSELGHLGQVAEYLNPRLEPVAQDLVDINGLAPEIQLRLDRLEMAGAPAGTRPN